jgi:hypothetical protein
MAPAAIHSVGSSHAPNARKLLVAPTCRNHSSIAAYTVWWMYPVSMRRRSGYSSNPTARSSGQNARKAAAKVRDAPRSASMYASMLPTPPAVSSADHGVVSLRRGVAWMCYACGRSRAAGSTPHPSV